MSFKKLVEQAARQAGVDAMPAPCQCLRTEVRERTIRGGSKQFVRQCLDCGESVGNPVKQLGAVAPFDEELTRRDRERRTAVRLAAQEAESARWWDSYHGYMASQEWADLRTKVLERDKYLCQGCLTAKATEVHHVTYQNFGAELAFQLLSLCRPCHERYHAKSDE